MNMKKMILVLVALSVSGVVGCQKKAETAPASEAAPVETTTTTTAEPTPAQEAPAQEAAAEPTPAA